MNQNDEVKESVTREQPASPCSQPSYASVLSSSTESLRSLLDKAENVEFAINDDTPCLIYKQQGSNVEKSVPIKVLKGSTPDEEYDLKYIKSCKMVKFARHHETGDPLLSIQNGRCRFPTPIALRTRARLKL